MISHIQKTRDNLRIRVLGWTATITHSKAFWLILALKIIASCFFGSEYLTKLFIPFLDSFASSPSVNPYDLFWSSGNTTNFPYPAAMLYIMAFPHWLLSQIGLNSNLLNIELFIYRIPILLADIAIFLTLSRWHRRRVELVLWLYWASPVLFYINYLHGQLDAVPVALAILSTYFLFSNRPFISALILGLAISTKMHMLLMAPFVLVYLWQDYTRFAPVLKYGVTMCLSFLIINAPYLLSDGFIHMVFMNAQQNKVGLAAFSLSNGIEFYLIPALLMALIIYATHIQIRNRDVFLIFIGFSFGIILLFIPPSQGWYYWVLPFFIYFYVRSPRSYFSVIIALQAAYFLYFALIADSDFTTLLQVGDFVTRESLHATLSRLGIDAPIALNSAFTGLQTLLLLNCVVVFYQGVYIPQRRSIMARPFMLGIAGDSGAGKSTISSCIQDLFGVSQLAVICGDDMHKWQRGHSQWHELTHLDPRANELHNELQYLKLLRENKLIWRRHYDHNTGEFTNKLPISPRPVMVMEGLHSFYLKPARDLFDLKIFVKPDPTLLLHRKVVRDMKKRNYTKEKVIRSIEERRKDSEKYIVTQERYADIIVSHMLRQPIAAEDIGNPEIAAEEWLRVTLSNEYFLDPIITDLLEMLPGAVSHYYDENDLQVLDFDRPPEVEDILALGEKYVEGLQQFGIYDPKWRGGWQGLMQLLIGYCIFHGWESEYGS